MDASPLYRLLLLAYPADFRRRYGAQMIAVFRQQRSEPRYARPRLGPLLFWGDILADLTASATRRRLAGRSGQPRFPRKRESFMATLLQDLEYALRGLRRQPGVTLAAVLTLAVAIGANTAMFSLVDGILLRPFPFPEPERLVHVWDSNPSRGWNYFSVSPPNFIDYREQNRGFDSMTSYYPSTRTLTGMSEPERVRAIMVGPDYFQTFGIEPQIGRAFGPTDNEPGSNHLAILSHTLWNRRFGGDPDVVGETITIGGVPKTVVGVFTEPTDAPAYADLWMPEEFSTDNLGSRGAHYFAVVGRLAPEATFEAARDDLRGIAARLAEAYPDTNSGWTVAPLSLHEDRVGSARQSLRLLTGAVALILLIGCANIANLLLARAARQRREFALRTALGAGRGRILSQVLSESILLGIFGGLLGLLVASAITATLGALAPDSLPRLEQVGIDPRVLGFTILLSVGAGFGFGVLPALQSASSDVNATLKQGDARGGNAGGGMRQSLVVVEVALAVVVVICAGLLLRTLWQVHAVDPGFVPDNRVTGRVGLSQEYEEPERQARFFDELLERIGAAPEISAVAATMRLPMGGDFSITFTIEGRAEPSDDQEPSGEMRIVSPGYFSAMGIPMLRGRGFSDVDRLDAQPVAVINERLAELYFPGEDPIGQRIRVGYAHAPDAERVREIVGVAGNVRVFGLASDPVPVYYVSYRQTPEPAMSVIAVAGDDDTAAAVATLRRELADMDRNVPLYEVTTMHEHIRGSTGTRRFRAVLLASFAAVALLLASIGIYGVMAYSVAQRSRELGIRMALGADRGNLMGMVLRRGLLLAGLGIALGALGSLGAGSLLSNLLFGVTSTDPATFAAVALFLLGIAVIACYLPARRATRVDPTAAMRAE